MLLLRRNDRLIEKMCVGGFEVGRAEALNGNLTVFVHDSSAGPWIGLFFEWQERRR